MSVKVTRERGCCRIGGDSNPRVITAFSSEEGTPEHLT